MGGFPVKIVDSGGLPVVASFDGGPAVTQSDNGIPVTVVESGGVPLSFVNDDLSEDLNLGALARVQAAAPDFVAWWTSADPTSMLLASDGVGGFVSASGQTVGGWLNVKDCGSKTFAQYLAAQPALNSNSGFDSDLTGWAANPSATIAWDDGTAEVDITGSGGGIISGNVTTVVGARYLLSARVRRGTYVGDVNLGYGPSTNTIGGYTLTDDWAVITGVFVATATTHQIYVRRGTAATGTYYVDDFTLKALPSLPLLQANATERLQYLLSGGIGSVKADGVNDFLSTGALASALPSDCAVYARVKTTDNRGYIFSGAATDSNEYFFCFQDGLTSPVYGNVGSPTLYVDDTEFTGHRGDYYDAISDGAQHSLVARSIDLSGLAALTLATYLPSPTVNYVSGAIGDILIVPEALLTAQPTLHADIMAMMAARSPS